MKNSKLKGNLILLLTAFVWGTSFIAQSVGMTAVSASSFNFVRSILGGLVLLPVIYFIDKSKMKQGKEIQPYNKKLFLAGIICGTILCFASTIQTMSMIYTSPGKSAFITALYMIFIPIFNFIIYRKKPSIIVAVAVISAVVGLYLLCINESFSINKGDLLSLVCSILFTFHIIWIDYFSPKVDGVKLASTQFFVCGILSFIWMWVDSPKPDYLGLLSQWKAICYSGFLSCGVAYTCQIIGQKYTDATSASIIMSLESVVATLSTVVLCALGWNLTGGTLTLKELIGCAIMFFAIILVQVPDFKK